MKYDEWEPIYQDICEYFSFDPADDERAAQIAANLSSADVSGTLSHLIEGRRVTVCGNAPSLKNELDLVSGVVIALMLLLQCYFQQVLLLKLS